MTSSPPARPDPTTRLWRVGRSAWSVVGIAIAVSIGYVALAAVSALVVPLVIAAVIGVLLYPVVDVMHDRLNVPRGIGAGAVLVAIAGILVVAVWLTVVGVVDQGPEIVDRIETGVDHLTETVGGVDLGGLDLGGDGTGVSGLVGGIAGWFGSAFSSVAAFLVGTFVATFFLYYLLADWHRIEQWIVGALDSPALPGEAIVDESSTALRRYFGALTLSSIITAVLIGVTAALLDVPLAFTIALVTFVTSYIPYLGAIFSGTFAVLIALGSVGTPTAVALLVVVLVVQSVIQTLVLTKLTSDMLRLHPIVNLSSTIIGAALAGLLGATLSAPVAVIVIRLVQRHGEAAVPGPAPGLSPGPEPAVAPEPATATDQG